MQKYITDPLDPKIVSVVPESNIDDILTANPKANKFIFLDGNFYITKVLRIDRSMTEFTSLSKDCTKVHIFQKDPTKDGILIRNVVQVLFKYISVHVTFDSKVALTVAGCNLTKVEDNHFYGNQNYFTIYYTGNTDLTPGEDVLNAYSTNDMPYGNVFRHNVVYSSWGSDCIAFCMQRNSLFTKNIIRGGKVAAYMCKNSYITSNVIYDSTSQGIYVSLPSHNLQIKYNKIYECKFSGIKLANQKEHGEFPATPYNMTIRENYIYDSKLYAIELNDAINVNIINNKFIGTDTFGIYCLRSENINIKDNKLSYFQSGVWSEMSKNINILENKFYSVYPDLANNVFKIVNSSNSVIENNEINGQIKYSLFDISKDSVNTKNNNNIVNTWYKYPEEYDITK